MYPNLYLAMMIARAQMDDVLREAELMRMAKDVSEPDTSDAPRPAMKRSIDSLYKQVVRRLETILNPG